MKKITTLAAITLSLSIAGCASASPRWNDHNNSHYKNSTKVSSSSHRWNRHNNESFNDTAKVIKVRPIYETVSIAVPEQNCWNEKVRHRHNRHNDSYTAPLFGALVGGVVGNQFGKHNGKKILTVAGSLLGASIANDVSKGNRRHNDRYRTERRCETTNRYESREEIVGYKVKYRYNGKTYRTRTDSHPGKRLRVSINITPRRY